MQENPNRRNAHIIALYLAKFNRDAITELECKTWNEAYIKVGKAFGYKYTAINHFRDYFDPFLPNERKGWPDPSEIVLEVFSEFGNYDFETFSGIVKDILKQDYIFTIYDPPSIVHLSFIKQAHLQQAVKEEKQYKQKYRDAEERKCVLSLQEQEGGTIEVPIFEPESNLLVGLADLITHQEVIEVKNIRNWKHAVGQVFAYWYYLVQANVSISLRPRIHLFGSNGINDHRIQLCQSLMEKIFSPYIDSTVVTYIEEDDDFDWF